MFEEKGSYVKTVAERQRDYRNRHPERVKEARRKRCESGRSAKYQKEWKKVNPGKQSAYNEAYWNKRGGKEAHNKYMKERYDPEYRHQVYLKRKDKCAEEGSKWGRTPEGRKLKRASWHRYMARKKAAEGSFTAEDVKDLYASQGARCYYCSVEIEERYHIEHMTPLSRGGRNDVSNICLACAPCNLKKYTKTAEEFQNAPA